MGSAMIKGIIPLTISGLTDPFCTLDKGEGIVKAKDLLRTALGSLQEPGVWRPKLPAGHPGIILGGTKFHPPSIRPFTSTMILLSGHPANAGCESAYSTERSSEADQGTNQAALVVNCSESGVWVRSIQ